MKVRSFTAAGLALALTTATFVAPAPVRADDAHLGENTIVLVSTSDFAQLKKAIDASDTGQFLADPEIRKIGENLKRGIQGLMGPMLDQMTAETGAEDPAAAKAMIEDFMTFGGNWVDALCEDMSGRVSFSVEMLMDPAAPFPMPNLILEFGGSDRLHEMHGQLLDKISAASGGEAPPKTTFTAGGFEFMGLIDEGPGMGVIIGRKGDRFLMGISKAGLEQYVAACDAGTERLGAQPFYKTAMGATGRGQMCSFINLSSVWGLVMMGVSQIPVSEGEPNPAQMIQAMGLTDLQGVSSSATWTPDGASTKSFVGMTGRKGLMRLIPTENKPLAAPPFSPSDVMSAGMFRLEISQFLSIMREFLAMAPAEEVAGFEESLAGMKEMLGFSLDELLADVEGTMFTASPAGAAAMNPMAMMMGGGAGLDFSMGMRLVTKDKFVAVMDKLAAPEVSNGMMSKEQVAGRDVWTMMVPNPQMPLSVSVAFEGDWMIVGSGSAKMQELFERADSGKNLSSNEAFQKMVQRVGGASGMMVTYTDTGKSLAQTVEMVRPLLGMIPLFVPDLQSSPEMLFLFDPANLPSAAVLEKYFGPTVTRGRIEDGGLMIDAWAPSRMAREKAMKKTEEAGKTGTGVGN